MVYHDQYSQALPIGNYYWNGKFIFIFIKMPSTHTIQNANWACLVAPSSNISKGFHVKSFSLCQVLNLSTPIIAQNVKSNPSIFAQSFLRLYIAHNASSLRGLDMKMCMVAICTAPFLIFQGFTRRYMYQLTLITSKIKVELSLYWAKRNPNN